MFRKYISIFSVSGNLALSRALGDLVFKKNEKMSAEEQIVTGIWSNNFQSKLDSLVYINTDTCITEDLCLQKWKHIHLYLT